MTGGGNTMGLVVVPAGPYLYVPNRNQDNVAGFSIGADGALTSLGLPTATGDDPRGGATTPDGRFLYVVNNVGTPGTVSAYAIGAGGQLTPVGATWPPATAHRQERLRRMAATYT